MKLNICVKTALASMLVLLLIQPVMAADKKALPGFPPQSKEKLKKVFPSKPGYSPYANRNFPSRPLFGDTHLHTAFSMDAGATGTRLSPVDAYRFAKGEQDVEYRPAGKIVPAAGFPGSSRSLRRHGFLSATYDR